MEVTGVVKVVNCRTGEVQTTVDVGDAIRADTEKFWLKRMYGQEEEGEIHSDFAVWAMLQLSGRTLVGASTGQIYMVRDDSQEQEELKLQERQQKI